MRPRLLDLFCCAGGAGVGYHRAGFDVVGVDIEQQPDYPFEFVQGDALTYLVKHWQEFDAIHASPPCQASTALTKGTNKGRQYVNLIPETRRLLAATGLPTVMENVQGSDLRRDLTLCGEMFGLGVLRHRYFEIENAQVAPPAHKPHRGRVRGWRHGVYYDGPYVAVYGEGGGKGTVEEWQMAMGIDWTDDRKSIAEAIPPAYTEFIGRQLLRQCDMKNDHAQQCLAMARVGGTLCDEHAYVAFVEAQYPCWCGNRCAQPWAHEANPPRPATAPAIQSFRPERGDDDGNTDAAEEGR